MSAVHSARTLPRTLGPFRLLSCIGQGGFAPVWRAEEVYEGRRLRDVAVKLFFLPDGYLPASAEAGRWLDGVIDEASALCRVEHANIVRFHTLLRDDAHGAVGLVMEYVPGKSLGAILRKGGPMNVSKVFDIGINMAWALTAVHNAGLVHRDVKPDNIIEASSRYKLVDFGIVAHGVLGSQTGSESPPLLVGTPGFIPPEYFDNRAFAPLLSESAISKVGRQTEAVSHESAMPSPAGDIYSLGATLFCLATGHLPSERPGATAGDNGDPIERQLGSALIEFAWLLLEPDPHRRPRYADWVARELETIRASVHANSNPRTIRTEIPAAKDSVIPHSSPQGAQVDTMQFMALQKGTERHTEAHKPSPRPSLVGRRESLALVERAAHDVQEGQIRIVLVTGTLGIGRTRFLEEALAQAGALKERTLRMHNSPERSGPLKPLLASIRALQNNHSFRLLESAIDRVLLPSVLPSTPTPELSLEAIEDALFIAAAEDTVIVAADDLQWADESTLALLQRIVDRADRGAKAKLLVLVTVRDEPRASTPLRTFLGSLKGRTRASTKHITLEPLSPPDIAALAQRVCPVESRVENILVRNCGGSPFFLVNALLAWHETGAIVWRDDAFHAVDVHALEEGIPGVAALLDARLASFFPPDGPLWRSALRTMAAVALYGGGLPADVLFDVLGDDDTTEDALDTFVGAGIFVVTGDAQDYGFAQEMVRLAALNLVRPKAWFRRLVRKLLDTIAGRSNADEEAAFLANGYEKLGERKDARVWLERAMDRSVRAGLFTEAMMLGDRLAAMAPDEDARIDVELTIVRALVQGRQFEEAKTRLDRMRSGESLLNAASGKTPRGVKWRILRLEVARGTSEAVADPTIVADADAVGDVALACEARISLAGVAPLESAIALIGKAVEMAERLSPALEFRARVLRFELVYRTAQRDLVQAENDLRRALTIARSTSSVWQEIHIEGDIAALETEMGHTEVAIKMLYRLAERARTLGMVGQRRMLLNNLAACLMREGRATEAAEVADQTAALAVATGDTVLHGISLSLQAYALYCAGDLKNAWVRANEAERLQRERDDGARALTLLRRALILASMGKAEEALIDAQTAETHATRHGETILGLTAVLLQKLHAARANTAYADDLRKALAAVEGAKPGQRALTRRLIEQATVWLEKIDSQCLL